MLNLISPADLTIMSGSGIFEVERYLWTKDSFISSTEILFSNIKVAIRFVDSTMSFLPPRSEYISESEQVTMRVNEWLNHSWLPKSEFFQYSHLLILLYLYLRYWLDSATSLAVFRFDRLPLLWPYFHINIAKMILN